MALNDSIDSLATGQYTVTRKTKGTYTDGIYSGGGTTTTFAISAVQEPATGLQRVVGGFEMRAGEDGQKSNDIRVVYTRVELFTRSDAYEPDLISINGRNYTVFRCEPWDLASYEANNEVHYRALVTRVTQGAT